jgi:hypothetical protein
MRVFAYNPPWSKDFGFTAPVTAITICKFSPLTKAALSTINDARSFAILTGQVRGSAS